MVSKCLMLRDASGFGESTRMPPQSPSSCWSSNSNNNDTANFEYDICLDLAQDPIVTLCGRLFCWPCLYKWLHIHSHFLECPVCKTIVEEEKLVCLYDCGKSSTDLRSKLIPGINIPNRPAGQRPQTDPSTWYKPFCPTWAHMRQWQLEGLGTSHSLLH